MTDTEMFQTTINLDVNLHRRTKAYCKKNKDSVNGLIVQLLTDYMKGKRVR